VNSGYEVIFTPRDAVNYDYSGVTLRRKVQLTVNKAQQTVTVPAIPAKTTADVPFNVNASVDTGLPLRYESSDEHVAVVSPDGTITVKGSGTATITAYQPGNDNYIEARAVQLLTVAQIPQLQTPPPVVFPKTNPVTYRPDRKLGDIALQNGSGDGSFAWAAPTVVPTAVNSGYEVVFTPRDAVNFDYSGVALRRKISLTVNKAPQTLTFPAIPDKTTADTPFNVNASVNTGLPLRYESSDESVAEVSPDGTVTVKGAGTATITAIQLGNDNYLEARAVQLLTVAGVTGVEDIPATAAGGYAYPNPVLHGETLYVVACADIPPGDAVVEIYDFAGRQVRRIPVNLAGSRTVSVQAPGKPGVYVLAVKSGGRTVVSMKVTVN
jgi:hypothetical protein